MVRTLTALQIAQEIDEIIVAAREEDLVEISRLCHTYGIAKCAKVVRGGESRAHSVLLAALEASPESELLAVQDGARPLVTPELIGRTVAAAARCGAAAPAVPVKDTIKVIRADSAVEQTLERDALRAVQTPQVFEAGLIRGAIDKAVTDGALITDDCAAVERLGMKVTMTLGDPCNRKITTPIDLVIGEAILTSWGA